MRTASTICIPLLLFTVPAFADSTSQTSWSYGPGVPGPVTEWGGLFSYESNINWSMAEDYISLLPYEMLELGFDSYDISPADLDGDGDMDMAAVTYLVDKIAWWQNMNSQGTVWVEHILDDYEFNNPMKVICSDIDVDGSQDFVACCSGTGLKWWRRESSGIWSEHLITARSGYTSATVFNIDGDSDPDVAASGYFGYSEGYMILWFENEGAGVNWTSHVIASTGHSTVIGSGDIDGDGYCDLVVTCPYEYKLTWLENSGGGSSWIEHTIYSGYGHDVTGLSVADIDDDGDMDVAGTATGGTSLAWFSNQDGSGQSWTMHAVCSDFRTSDTVLSVDYDMDDDMDLLHPVKNWLSDGSGALLWENLDGVGTSWRVDTLCSVLPSAMSAAAADVDSDGYPELFCGGTEGSTMWNTDDWQDSGELVSSIIYLNDADWVSLSWAADTPVGSAATFQVRASDDYTQMGVWSDIISTPGSLDGILENYDSFLQYRAILSRSDPDVTPVLHDVTFTWNSLGVHGEDPLDSFTVLPVSPNPAHGALSITFGVPSAATVDLSVYDLAGRVVFRTGPVGYQAGYHDIQPGVLPPGVYLAVGRSEGVGSTVRFTVLE